MTRAPPQGVEGQPVAILAQNSDNGRNYMDRDVSIEGIQNSGMWNVHDSPRKWVDDQGLPDGTTTEMVKNKTRGANEKREKGKRRDGRQMEREDMHEKRRPSCLGRVAVTVRKRLDEPSGAKVELIDKGAGKGTFVSLPMHHADLQEMLEVRLDCPLCPRRFCAHCSKEEWTQCEEWLRWCLLCHLKLTVRTVGMENPEEAIRRLVAKPKVKVVQVCDVPSDAGLKKGPWAEHDPEAIRKALLG